MHGRGRGQRWEIHRPEVPHTGSGRDGQQIGLRRLSQLVNLNNGLVDGPFGGHHLPIGQGKGTRHRRALRGERPIALNHLLQALFQLLFAMLIRSQFETDLTCGQVVLGKLGADAVANPNQRHAEAQHGRRAHAQLGGRSPALARVLVVAATAIPSSPVIPAAGGTGHGMHRRRGRLRLQCGQAFVHRGLHAFELMQGRERTGRQLQLMGGFLGERFFRG